MATPRASWTANVVFAIVGIGLTACAAVPETGRSQLLLMSASEETALGIREFEKMKQELPISNDPAVNAMVQEVGKAIAAVAPLPDAQWEFVVFDKPDIANAFCLPGGKVGVYTGILPITKNKTGLATVLGHEVAHAVARHGGERMSRAMLVQLGGKILDEALQSNSAATRSVIHSAYGLGSTVGLVLPHSREQELESDHLGLLYMARAGYDPREAVSFWQRFRDYKQGGKAPPEFLSTHPMDTKRIAQLQSLMPQALGEYEKAPKH